uniref:Uncharacterized protein n=1 Tax=Rousettus aegyptiacus TaxID=9407 RepID=A0A7J8B8R7_ROUAE|nr:hypothetical protein HJG63_010045 [Rousettus aegyptiacus]
MKSIKTREKSEILYLISICLPMIYLSLFLYLPTYLSSIYHLSIYHLSYLSIYLSIYLSSIYLYLYLSLYHLSYLSIYLSIMYHIYHRMYLSISIYLSIYLSSICHLSIMHHLSINHITLYSNYLSFFLSVSLSSVCLSCGIISKLFSMSYSKLIISLCSELSPPWMARGISSWVRYAFP